MAGLAKIAHTARAGRISSPLLNDHAPDLAIACANVGHRFSISAAEGTVVFKWPENVRSVETARQLGIEPMIQITRSCCFGRNTNLNHQQGETAGGQAAATENLMVFTTPQEPTIHTVIAVKQAATNNHISVGHLGVDIAAGMCRSSDARMDYMTLSWADYDADLTPLGDQILPLISQAGPRHE